MTKSSPRPVPTQEQPSLGARIGKWLILIASSGVIAGVVGGGVSAYVSAYLTEKSTVQIENSKSQYERRIKVIETFDSTNNDLLAKIAVLNTDVLDGRKINQSEQAEVTQALIKAQVATNELEEIVPSGDKALIEDYKKQLANLGKAIQGADQLMSLRPVFAAVAQLLPLHDQLASDARASLKIRGAFGG